MLVNVADPPCAVASSLGALAMARLPCSATDAPKKSLANPSLPTIFASCVHVAAPESWKMYAEPRSAALAMSSYGALAIA